MRRDDDIDLSEVDREKLAGLMRREAEGLAPRTRRNEQIDTAPACEALANSRALHLRSLARIPAE